MCCSNYAEYTDGNRADKKYVYLDVNEWITLESDFTLDTESWIAKKDNRIQGMLVVNCSGTWNEGVEINIGNIANSLKSSVMNRTLYAYCGSYKYQNAGNLYCATSGNGKLRFGYYQNTTLSTNNKRVIVISIDYIN